MSNIVYFIGAGFSKTLGGPSQAEILPMILNLTVTDGNHYGNGEYFFQERDRVYFFLKKAFPRVPKSQWSALALEYLFSIMDRAILNKDSFRQLTLQDMVQARAALIHTIIHLFDIRLKNLINKDILVKFFNYLSSKPNLENNYSFITTNWDLILDNRLYPRWFINQSNEHMIKLLDYGCECCYFEPTPLTERDRYPTLNKIFLCKLHGSLNWLVCPNCNRLFFKIGEKIAIREFVDPQPCYVCNNSPGNPKKKQSLHLQSLVIMPTMLKEIKSLHLQQVWQKAAQILSNADQLIFIGYSFPLADFEIRYLLAHHLKKNCRINVILHTNDNSATFQGAPPEHFPPWRYKTFFGIPDSEICYEGLEGYVNSRHHR